MDDVDAKERSNAFTPDESLNLLAKKSARSDAVELI